ncbi:hypothetical protein FXN63_17395 [Pigmentiphaga aceris]|uniref:Uncharacterized protein n=1 Tax=Pigmentiphaga aceris TaxID=1940612 RepID=A0A5C0AYE1_9BURK|nr:hypothetical protein [Pigmentiphaga aceris]QEI07418.1 hypothetical protein FXN63_17395 [Pigmentiphaga aceris]
MSTAAVRTRAKNEIDIPSLVHHIREVNKQAVRIASTPPADSKGLKPRARRELVVVLNELEKTLKTLRIATADVQSVPNRVQTSVTAKPAAKQVTAALVLDTTEAMIEKGQLLTPVEFQRLMGWASRQAVWKAAKTHRVFYLTHQAERYFPAFYGDARYDRSHLEAVTKVLGDLPGGAKLQFFLTRKGSLGGSTPLDALADGRFAKVKDVAAAFAEVSTEA